MYKNDGVLRKEDLSFPNENQLKKGKIAFIECVENIPCNPCETSCPVGAIKIGDKITNLPQIEYEKCTGCGLCVAVCPGLAIFLLNKYANEDKAEITLPIEILPLPENGEEVITLNREGKEIGTGIIKGIREIKIQPKRKLVTIEVPREHLNDVRHFKRK